MKKLFSVSVAMVVFLSGCGGREQSGGGTKQGKEAGNTAPQKVTQPEERSKQEVADEVLQKKQEATRKLLEARRAELAAAEAADWHIGPARRRTPQVTVHPLFSKIRNLNPSLRSGSCVFLLEHLSARLDTAYHWLAD